MRRLPILVLSLAPAQLAWAVDPQPQAVDAALWAAASTGGFRALVFRECSPEHCWTRLYVQAETPGANPTEYRCVSEVKELGYGTFISELSWQAPADATLHSARLTAQVSPSHGGFEPYEATITVGNDCGYKVVPSRPAD